jgi:hypothetical protein
MSPHSRTFEYGTLDSDTDTFFLRKPNRFVLLDVPFAFDESSLLHKAVSVIGTVGEPASAPGIKKLIVDKLVSHADIAKRAYKIYQSDRGASADDNWLRAERELLYQSSD